MIHLYNPERESQGCVKDWFVVCLKKHITIQIQSTIIKCAMFMFELLIAQKHISLYTTLTFNNINLRLMYSVVEKFMNK